MMDRLTRAIAIAALILAGASVLRSQPGQIQAQNFLVTDGPCNWSSGTGTPEGVVTGNICDMFSRDDGSTDTVLYIKDTGTGNTGWVPLGEAGGGGSVTWENVQDPGGVFAMSIGNTETSTWTVIGNTAAANMFRMIDETGNTGTGHLFEVATIGTSAMSPFSVVQGGNDSFVVDADGNSHFGDGTNPGGQYWSEETDDDTCTGTQVIDWDIATAHACLLTGNITTLTLSNPEAGGKYSLILNQDATGNFTIVWPANVLFAGGTEPSLGGANVKNICALVYSDENSGEYYASCVEAVS